MSGNPSGSGFNGNEIHFHGFLASIRHSSHQPGLGHTVHVCPQKDGEVVSTHARAYTRTHTRASTLTRVSFRREKAGNESEEAACTLRAGAQREKPAAANTARSPLRGVGERQTRTHRLEGGGRGWGQRERFSAEWRAEQSAALSHELGAAERADPDCTRQKKSATQ